LDVKEEARCVFVAIRDDRTGWVVRALEIHNAEIASDGVFDDGVRELNCCKVTGSIDVHKVKLVPIVGIVGMKRRAGERNWFVRGGIPTFGRKRAFKF
jgi:hypothetical protein